MARHRPLALALAAALTACAMVVGVATAEAKPAGAGPGPPSGNKESAKACQKGAWMNVVRSDGTGFSSEAECTSYAAQGGTLQPKPTLLQQAETICTNSGGSWYTDVSPTGEPFWTCQWDWDPSEGSPHDATTLDSLATVCRQMPSGVFYDFGVEEDNDTEDLFQIVECVYDPS